MEFSITLAIIVLIFLVGLNVRQNIIFEYERGLLYRQGKFQRVLSPGRHWSLRFIHSVHKIDIRNQFVTLPGQEVLSADNITIKISLAASYQVDDPYLALNKTANYQAALYLLLQLQLRDLVGATNIEELLAKRKEIGGLLYEATVEKAQEIGTKLLFVNIKDVMFPGELKNIFAQVVNARKEGLAALERARGESAALRNLANSTKLLERHPGLLPLRLLQTLSQTAGNTIILTSSLENVSLDRVAKLTKDDGTK
jgi:regulator of protease activity HflC (stomatin/prohibitin superfamily)